MFEKEKASLAVVLVEEWQAGGREGELQYWEKKNRKVRKEMLQK